MVEVSHVFGATDTITAAKFNTNFSDIESALASLRSTNLASDAGIEAGQLADRYSTDEPNFNLVPINNNVGGAAIVLNPVGVAGTRFTLQTATLSTYMSRKITAKAGQEVYLCEIEVHVVEAFADSGNNVTFRLLKNGVAVGATLTLSLSDGFYRNRRSSTPIAAPLVACADGDELDFQLGTTAGTACGTRGVSVRLLFKRELVS